MEEENAHKMFEATTPRVAHRGRLVSRDMAEISGFGGSYERVCRLLMLEGLHILENEPVTYIRGSVLSLEKHMVEGVKNKIAGGITHAQVFWARAHAWLAHEMGYAAYCEQSKRKRYSDHHPPAAVTAKRRSTQRRRLARARRK